MFLIGFASLLALGLASVIEELIPAELGSYLAGTAVDRLLNIIANAMLAVTIFSLTVMVNVYRSSSTQWTPRVHRLIMQDGTTQNTLATFIGTYVYALVAIILRELGVFADHRALVLFVLTVLVLCLIVFSLIRWVLHLQTLGSLLHTTRQVEDITKKQFEERLETPCLGANCLTDDIPEKTSALTANETGYVKQIYPEALNSIADEHGVKIYLPCAVGDFVFLNEPFAYVEGSPKKISDFEEAFRENFQIGDLRSYEQDPRFGILVMGEIGSKALSPGINDPGTAIDVITRVGRILSFYRDETNHDEDVLYPYLWAPPMKPSELIDDAFGSMARDGASVIEVQILLQKILKGLMQHPDEGLSEAALDHARNYYRRAMENLDFEEDRKRLESGVASEVRSA